MPVRTRPLVKLQVVATTGADLLFTCPPDRTAIVKDARLRVTGTAGVVRLVVADFGTVGGLDIVTANGAGPVQGDAPPGTWIALAEGDTLYLLGAVGKTADVWVSGTLLDGDPA